MYVCMYVCMYAVKWIFHTFNFFNCLPLIPAVTFKVFRTSRSKPLLNLYFEDLQLWSFVLSLCFVFHVV